MSNTTHEINKLGKAVNDFSIKMKEELSIQAAKGRRGWDADSADDLFDSFKAISNHHFSTVSSKENRMSELVKIANYAMMVHKALEEGR